ncbi:helix-turn-helix domain-containing protein [Actinophytocola algeriensis]|uniref:Transcriptional regulator with XRE-family HTH domain n=1 Tax=Actinophytocola algeriensis TaxID=1768010 RepID=A0A7W7Q5U6_9PSEU|nr:XRE family transcriptional regulator [Actinophytocola algeriensis]MBB4907358.1 transcriptional regulator with XRE-family HTH domain [Actinophytocola algeriensis]MBE1478841.1 transcriptional regulator with XRE-family HTH domain [Actinophytocola algeriensis]
MARIIEEQLGRLINAKRTGAGLSLQELSQVTGVSVSMLSAVERGEKTPTVVVLDRIAEGLDLRLSALVSELETDRVVLRRAAAQDTVDEDGWRRTILTPVVPGVNFEWIRTTLPPRTDAGDFPAYAPGSHEFVVVTEGTLHLGAGGREYVLAVGDSLYFPADAVHSYANRGDLTCEYYVAALIMRPRR